MSTRFAVAAYFVSACLARAADAGAIIGIVLLAHGVAPNTALAGLLAACITAPHLAGPLAARVLDRSTRQRLVLAAAFTLYAIALAGGGILLARHLLILAAVSIVIAGACGPLLTGGLSSLLGGLIAGRESSQRRAQGMDAFTYGVAATVGPATVTIVAATTGPLTAICVAAGLAVLAAVALSALPVEDRSVALTSPALTVRDALRVLARAGPLRRVAVAATLAALPIGAISLLAIAFVLGHGGRAIDGATLVTVNGVGGLIGSTIAIVRPLRGDPERLTRNWTLAVAVGFLLCALSPSVPTAAVAFGLLGAVTSIQFAATLAARSSYSPPGARAQLFVTMAGLKVAFSSLGVALVGISSGVGSVWLLTAGAVLVLIGVGYMIADATHAHPASP